MRSTLAVFTNECILFARNRLQLWGVLLFMVIGGYSISYGHAEIRKENERRQLLEDSIHSIQATQAAALHADTLKPEGRFRYETAALPSLVRFNYNFPVARKPAPLAALSLGQLDVTPAYYILNAQSLYVQTLKGEIVNPFKLKAGNFDLAFVLVYLLPLLVIALCFDVLSAEKEAGVLPLLRISHYSLKRIVLVKCIFRLLVACSVAVLLSLVAFYTAKIPLLSPPALLWLLIVCGYIALWQTILLLIVSFNRSSALNAMVSLGVWVLVLIVIPVTIQVQSTSSGPSSLSLSALMRSRNMEESSTAMQQALDEFYSYYPQIKPAGSGQSPFYYFQGYSAFLYNTDRAADTLVTAYQQTIQGRAANVNRFIFINPAANTLMLLNHVAGTDLSATMAFKQQVAGFHQQLFWFANRPLFQNRYMTREDYRQAPVFKFTDIPVNADYLAGRLLQQLLLAALCLIAAMVQLQEKRLAHE